MTPTEEADVVIVGGGAAGALFAARLAEAGKSVTVIEAGRPWTRADLVSSQIWARRLKWSGPPMLAEGADARGLAYVTGSGLGGAALHHYAAWSRLRPEDFRLASDHGVGHDWPIGYDDLRPYYDRVQAECGIAGDAAAEPWRPPADPYPMPPTARFRQGDILARGFAARGRVVAPSPCAITSQEYRGRPGCLYDGWCDAGCPTGALANPLTLHIPRARAAGARLVTGAAATRVVVERGRPAAVDYVVNGTQRSVRARVIVLAANPVQNARLLLVSGIGDRSGLVGRFLAMHTIAGVYGLFDEETDCAYGHTAGQVFTQEDCAKPREGGAFGAVTWIGGASIKPNDLIGVAAARPDLYGARLAAFMTRASRHLAQMGSVNETIARPENRVELATETDANGTRLPRVTHTLDPRSRALWKHARADGLTTLRAAGATEAWAGPPVTTHLMGGAIMGSDPARSVTDGFGRLHDAPNVIVAGPGLFPSTGAVGPTFTVYALAERTLDHLTAHWADHAG